MESTLLKFSKSGWCCVTLLWFTEPISFQSPTYTRTIIENYEPCSTRQRHEWSKGFWSWVHNSKPENNWEQTALAGGVQISFGQVHGTRPLISKRSENNRLLARNQGTDSLASHFQSQSLFQDLGEMPTKEKAWENQRTNGAILSGGRGLREDDEEIWRMKP